MHYVCYSSTALIPPFTDRSSLSPIDSLSMPPSLPVELLQQIVEDCVPSKYHSKTSSERDRTIARLSSVCRLFYRMIQPLVHEVVVFDFRSIRASRMAAALQDKAVIKEAVCMWDGRCSREDFEVFRSNLSECNSITIKDGGWRNWFDLSLLAELPSTSSCFFSVCRAV